MVYFSTISANSSINPSFRSSFQPSISPERRTNFSSQAGLSLSRPLASSRPLGTPSASRLEPSEPLMSMRRPQTVGRSHSPYNYNNYNTPDSPRSVASTGASSFSNRLGAVRGLSPLGAARGTSPFRKEKDSWTSSTLSTGPSSYSALGLGTTRAHSPESRSSLLSSVAQTSNSVSQLGLGAPRSSSPVAQTSNSVSQLGLGAPRSSSPVASKYTSGYSNNFSATASSLPGQSSNKLSTIWQSQPTRSQPRPNLPVAGFDNKGITTRLGEGSPRSLSDYRSPLEKLKATTQTGIPSPSVSPTGQPSGDVLKFLFECIDTNSDDKISSVELKMICITHTEVATLFGVDHTHSISQVFDGITATGKTGIGYDELCAFIDARGGTKIADLGLATRRKLVFDFISRSACLVTLYTIAEAYVEHPTFLKFTVEPQGNAELQGALSQIYASGKGNFSTKLAAFDEFCNFLDRIGGLSGDGLVAKPNILCDELLAFMNIKEVGSRSMDVVPSGDGNSSLVSGGKSTTRNELSYTLSGTPADQDDKPKWGSISSPNQQIGHSITEWTMPMPMKLNDMEFSHAGLMMDKDGSVVRDFDGAIVRKSDVVCRSNGNVLLQSNGKPVTRSELSFSMDSVLIDAEERPVLQSDGRPLVREDLVIARDGKPTLEDNKLVLRGPRDEHIGQEPSSQERVPSFSTDGSLMDAAGNLILGSNDGLPLAKGEVVLGPDGELLLSSSGDAILTTDLKVHANGTLLGPDGLRVIGSRNRRAVLYRRDDLLLDEDASPVFSNEGMLVKRKDAFCLGDRQIPRVDLAFGDDGCLMGPDGSFLLGDDALIITKGEMLIGPDNKPVLTPEGALVSVNDLTFSHSGTLMSPGGRLVLARSGTTALKRDEILLTPEGRPKLDCEGRVIETRDVVHGINTAQTLRGSITYVPITRADLYFTPQGVLMGLGTVIIGKDGLPITKGEVLMGDDGKPLLCEGGYVVTEDDLSISDSGTVVAMDKRRIFGLDDRLVTCEKLLLRADARPRLNSDGKLMVQEDVVRSSDGRPILGKDNCPVARTDLNFSRDGLLVDAHYNQILGRDRLPIMRGDILIDGDGIPMLTPNGQLITEDELWFAPNGNLLAPGGQPILGRNSMPLRKCDVIARHGQLLKSIHAALA